MQNQKNKFVIPFVISEHSFLNLCVFVLFLVAGVLGFGVRAQAADYYVSPTATSTDWAAAQDINTPCTPATAMANAQAGDTVYFRGGSGDNYTFPAGSGDPPTPGWNPTNNGSPDNYITFRNYPGEIPHLQSSNTNMGALIGVHTTTGTRSWIIWDGFKLSAANWAGEVVFRNAEHCILRNCEIIGVTLPTDPGGGGNYDGVRIQESAFIKVCNCKIHGMQYQDRCHGDGVKFYGVSNCEVYQCTFYDVNCGICDKSGGKGNRFYKNFIYNISPEYLTEGYGILAGEMQAYGQPDDIKIYQNVIVENQSDGPFIAFHQSGTNLYAYNNTIYGTPAVGRSGMCLSCQPGTIAEIYNNIVVGTARAFQVFSDDSPSYLDHNCYYDGQNFAIGWTTGYSSLAEWQSSGILLGGGNPDVNSIYQNPLFISAGGFNPEDYKLDVDSPALNLCVDRQDYDNDGNTTETISAGAYITGDEIIGYTDSGASDTTPPSRSNPQPTGTLSSGTTSTTISLDTDETAICKYSANSGTNYDLMENTFANTNSTSHSTIISNLEDGNSYTYYIRCQDESNNQNTDDFEISFSIASSTTYSLSNFIQLVSDWLKSESGLESDVNGDGVVNTRDLGIMMSNWQE